MIPKSKKNILRNKKKMKGLKNSRKINKNSKNTKIKKASKSIKIKKNSVKQKTTNKFHKLQIKLLPPLISKTLDNTIKNNYIIKYKDTQSIYNLDIEIDELLNQYFNKFNNISQIYQQTFMNTSITNIKYTDIDKTLKEIYPPIIELLIILIELHEKITKEEKNEMLADIHNIKSEFNVEKMNMKLRTYLNNNEKIKNDLYDTIYSNDNTFRKKFISQVKSKFPDCKLESSEDKLFYSEFTSLDIQNCIYSNIDMVATITFENKDLNISQKDIKIFYSSKNKTKNEINRLSRIVINRILFFNNYKRNLNLGEITKIPIFTIYLCKNKKVLPETNVFDINNINSAVTDTVSNIMIFREEELLKSILHECIHFHNLDFPSYSYPANFKKEILSIKEYNLDPSNELKLGEAYTETFANLLNIIFTLTKLDPTKYINTSTQQKIKFYNLSKPMLKKYLLYEFKFSIYQYCKIMNFIEDRNIKLIQKTSVFSYHILKCQLLLNLLNLLNKLNYSNLPIKTSTVFTINLKFNMDMSVFHKEFIAYTNNQNKKLDSIFSSIIKTIKIKKPITQTDKILYNSLRMTCINF